MVVRITVAGSVDAVTKHRITISSEFILKLSELVLRWLVFCRVFHGCFLENGK